jgi:cardiolipin synthase A/B
MAPTSSEDATAVDPAAPWAEVVLGPNRVAVLKDGAQAYPSMLQAIARATRTIVLETYILRDDRTGRRFITALEERARAGVTVLLMFDGWGSSVSDESLSGLRDAGVKVVIFSPVRFGFAVQPIFARLMRRNHRKCLVVDGKVGFTGGLNISDDYASVGDGGDGWRDTHMRISGAAAQELEALFLVTWQRQRGPRYDTARFKRPAPPVCAAFKVIGNDFALHRKEIRKAYVAAFNRAHDRVFITQAYFLPPAKLLRDLYRAARRGVRVAVIVAATTDVKLVLWGARGLYPKLLKNGVEVYEWQGRVLHAKTMVVDGTWATVGSSNLDSLSLRRNLEVNAVIEDATFGAAMERLFVDDLTHCERVTPQSIRDGGLLRRFLAWVAYQLRHWL